MNLNEAKQKFSELLLNTKPEMREDLINFIKNSEEIDDFISDSHVQILESIAEKLREVVPSCGVLESESIVNLDDPKTEHIDAFLFPDDVLDDLCDEGKMSRHYCLNCGCKKTQKLDLVSHSFSVWELKWLFTKILPPLTNKAILDVGSRLGCVLYAAAEYTNSSRIIGVELNPDFCALQNSIIEQYSYDKIEVIQADIRTQDQLLRSADVIILNNVFEHFLNLEDQAKCWDVVFGNVKRKGQIIVTVPSLQESLDELNGQLPDNWVSEIEWQLDEELVPDECDLESLKSVHLYQVL